ncbi:MAG TPA: hypothetical protein VGN01_18650 [Acidobacteriaceae bacterium]|jgi:hypothetical protein
MPSPTHATLILTLALPLALVAQPPVSPAPAAKPVASPTRASLAGAYDGGQMEVGAQLLLKPDGHFQYELAYGALDEAAEGTWEIKGSAVLLTTVPAVSPPRFVVVSDTPAPSGLFVKLAKPLVEGMRQRVLLLYGTVPKYSQDADEADVNDDGSVDIPAGKHPSAFIPEIPVYPMQPEPIALSGTGGHRFVLRFEPHDIGKANFRATPLTLADGVLTMTRPDLQLQLHFRRQK